MRANTTNSTRPSSSERIEVYLSQLEIVTQGKTPSRSPSREEGSGSGSPRPHAATNSANWCEPIPTIRKPLVTAVSCLPWEKRHQLSGNRSGRYRLQSQERQGNYVTDPIKVDGYGILILRIEDRPKPARHRSTKPRNRFRNTSPGPKMQDLKLRDYLSRLRLVRRFSKSRTDTWTAAHVPGKDTRWHEVVGLKPETTTKEEVAAHRQAQKFLGIVPTAALPQAPERQPHRKHTHSSSRWLQQLRLRRRPRTGTRHALTPTAPVKQGFSCTITPLAKPDALPPTPPVKQDPTSTTPPIKKDAAPATPPVKKTPRPSRRPSSNNEVALRKRARAQSRHHH